MENNICKLAFGVWLPNPNVKAELTRSGSEMYKILYNLYIKLAISLSGKMSPTLVPSNVIIFIWGNGWYECRKLPSSNFTNFWMKWGKQLNPTMKLCAKCRHEKNCIKQITIDCATSARFLLLWRSAKEFWWTLVMSAAGQRSLVSKFCS